MTSSNGNGTPRSAVADDVDRQRALAARFYIDDAVLAEEKERLFFRTWQYACHISELASPGDYVAAEILGQNVLVVRDQRGDINGYHNVCPHRGHKLAEGMGNKRAFVCPYHQWTFSLDGSLRGMRSSPSSQPIDNRALCLKPVRVDSILGFVFFNLDPDAEPIAEFWPGLEEQVLAACPDVLSYTLSSSASALHSVDVKANWKIQVDNFLECYHCGLGHLSFSDILDVPNQRQSLYKNFSYAFIPSSGKAENLAHPIDLEHDVTDLHFWHLFPNLGFGQFAGPGNFSLSQWIPIGPHRAYRRVIQLDVAELTDPGMLARRERRTVWARDVLQPEDIGFIESAHQGMSQRGFEHGWYMIDPENEEISEVMLRHFHETYLEHMG